MYDKRPRLDAGPRSACAVGWDDVAARIAAPGARIIAVEAYPGVRDQDLFELARRLRPDEHLETAGALKPAEEIERTVAPFLTDDPVFGRLSDLDLDAFFDPARLRGLRERVRRAEGTVLVTGPGAALVAPDGLLVYADLPRWEAQLRQRAGEPGAFGARGTPAALYKRGYFVDWRAADRHKARLWDRIDLVLETVTADRPKLAAAEDVWAALRRATARPFRVVPYFDPAPWGGEWMRRVCDLDGEAPNYGWCFDCVPEENSLLLGFGDVELEIPALDLVLREPGALLGEPVHARFGAEFPIRFDFLDTVGGGNLSLQVHPSAEYIREQFGMAYTQDESYYVLEAGPGSSVFLGLREGVDRQAFEAGLRRGGDFEAEAHVNRWPARRHDHFLIPAGTVHCSGAGTMVLEISATPYIFTFKLWDWDRPGLDGRPRPLHLDHGLRSIRWERDSAFARSQLINRVQTLAEGEGWREERTGLHELEFIETRRHWFEVPVRHPGGAVQVLNLVEGASAVVESPDGCFDPFEVHYAETFIVPAAAGDFRVRPGGPGRHATIRASVR